MGFYSEHVLPHIISCGCSHRKFMRLRERLVPMARGEVLEVGMGSGLNLRYYDPQLVSKVWGLEPCDNMRERARQNLTRSPVAVEWLGLPGEQIPLADASVDTVLLTFTLCTIPDWQTAMAGIKRVLKADGQLLFCEHGLAPDPAVQRWQQRLDNGWGKLFGGCHLNRPVLANIEASGFVIDWHDSDYMSHVPGFAGYISLGVARHA